MAPVRWSASFSLTWRPLLTFTRRRMELLEWFDQHVEISGFTEDVNHVGIAVASVHRLVVNRSSVTIFLLDRDADAQALSEALDGVAETLQLGTVKADLYLASTSVEITGEYQALCLRLARRMAGFANDDDTLGLDDCSALLDFRDSDAFTQVEFGIVSADELRIRLESPHLARLSRNTGSPRAVPVHVPSSLPDVSLFAEVARRPDDRKVPARGEAIVAALTEADTASRRLVEALKARI